MDFSLFVFFEHGDFEGFPLVFGHGVEDKPAGEAGAAAQEEGGGQDGGIEGQGAEGEHPLGDAHCPEEEQGFGVFEDPEDGPEDVGSVHDRVELALATRGAVPVGDGNFFDLKEFFYGVDAHLAFHFEPVQQDRTVFDEFVGEYPVSAEHVLDVGSEEQVDTGSDQEVAHVVHGALVFLKIVAAGEPVPYNHVSSIVESVQHGVDGLCGVGVISVDHDVDVGLDFSEGFAHGCALSFSGAGQDFCPGLFGQGHGLIRAAVVDDDNFGLWEFPFEVGDDFGNGDFFVEAGDEDYDGFHVIDSFLCWGNLFKGFSCFFQSFGEKQVMAKSLYLWFFSDVSPFWRRYFLGVLLAFLTVSPLFVSYTLFVTEGRMKQFSEDSAVYGEKPVDVVEGRFFPVLDPDAGKWMLLVEQSFKDGTWRMGYSPVDALGLAGLDTVYWSSGYFLYLRVITGIFLLFGLSLPVAVGWAAWVSGPILLCLGIPFFVWLSLRILPSFWGLFFMPILFFDPRISSVFSAYMPDHHGMIFYGMMAWMLLFFYPSRWAWVYSGVALGVTLWLSVTTCIPLLGVFGIGVLVSALSGRQWVDNPVVFRKWGVLAAAVGLLLWSLDYVPARVGMRLEIINPLWCLTILGGGELLYRFSEVFMGRKAPVGFLGQPSHLIDWGLPILLVIASPFAIAYSGGSWFWPAYPWVKNLMEVISELQPVAFSTITLGSGFVTFLLLLFFFFLVGKSPFSGFFVSGILAAVCLAFQTRWQVFFSYISIFALLLGLSELVRVYGEGWKREYVYRTTLFLLGVVGLSVFVPNLVYYVNEHNKRAMVFEGDSSPFRRTISDAQASGLMRQIKGGDFVVLGPPDLGTKTAYYGGGRTVGSMYWEAWRGLRESAAFWGADMDPLAWKVLIENHVDFVIFRGDMPTRFSKEGGIVGGEPLWNRISAGKVPDWLEKVDWVPTDGSGYKMFRVIKEKVPGL